MQPDSALSPAALAAGSGGVMPDRPVRLTRHADHDPSLTCRPALGYGLCEVLEESDDGPDDGDPSCSWCGGQPDLQECDDPIQCCDPRCDGTWHPCTACQGTGLARYQVLW